MNVSTRRLQISVLAIIALTLTIHAQGGSITITPANPTLLVGESVALGATGAVVPSAIGAGSGHTCVLYSDQSLRCTGQNSQGQVGNGGWTAVLEPAVVPAV